MTDSPKKTRRTKAKKMEEDSTASIPDKVDELVVESQTVPKKELTDELDLVTEVDSSAIELHRAIRSALNSFRKDEAPLAAGNSKDFIQFLGMNMILDDSVDVGTVEVRATFGPRKVTRIRFY